MITLFINLLWKDTALIFTPVQSVARSTSCKSSRVIDNSRQTNRQRVDPSLTLQNEHHYRKHPPNIPYSPESSYHPFCMYSPPSTASSPTQATTRQPCLQSGQISCLSVKKKRLILLTPIWPFPSELIIPS